jgi:hypothetical protein
VTSIGALPDHLEYTEVNVPDEDNPDLEAYPLVECKITGCRWEYAAAWHEFDRDPRYGTDWDALHPEHKP